MNTTTIIRDGDEVEITVYDSEGNPIQRIYGSIERPRIEHGDLERFGWDFDIDHVTIGELAQEGESEYYASHTCR